MNAVCFVGVDGTGKSTLIKKICKEIGDENCDVQYMGLYNWETSFAKWCMKDGKRRILKKVLTPISLITEFWHRYYKHYSSNKIVLFDRYTYEQLIRTANSNKKLIKYIVSFLYYIFLVKVYPKPSLIIYLHCSIQTSIARKDDIDTEDEIDKLKRNKALYDQHFLNHRNVFSVNTGNNDIDEIVKLIIDEMKNRYIL